jgi:hypothetical protein
MEEEVCRVPNLPTSQPLADECREKYWKNIFGTLIILLNIHRYRKHQERSVIRATLPNIVITIIITIATVVFIGI